MRHHHDGHFLARIQLIEELKHEFGTFAVKVSGRFVGEKERRTRDNRASNRNALLLPARKLRWEMSCAICEPNGGERLHGALCAFSTTEWREQQRKLHILKRCQYWNEVVRLEDDADFLRTPRSKRIAPHVHQVVIANPQFT
jgi:hypothetical protein